MEELAQEIEQMGSESVESIDLSIPYRTALVKAQALLKSPYLVWQSLEVGEQHRLFYFIFEQKLPFSQDGGYRTDKIQSYTRLFEEFVVQNSTDVEMVEIESTCNKALRELLRSVVHFNFL